MAVTAETGSVRLDWPGRSWRAGSASGERGKRRAAEARQPHAASTLRAVEHIGDGRQRLVQADALSLVRALKAEGLAGKVDLVYVDPPYASERDYVAEARLDGPADGRLVRSKAYVDTWSAKDGGLGAYLDMLAPRLEALTDLLAPTGSIWVHLDWRAAYLVRVILDEILGRDAFRNEVVWRRAPNLGRQATSGQFGRTLDTVVVYGKSAKATLRPPTRLEPIEPSAIRWDDEGRPFTSAPRGDYTDASIARLDAEGRVHRTPSGKVYVKYFLVKNGEGVWCRERRVDALWTDVPPLRHAPVSERTGYPTQKPRALLERIVQAGSPPDGLVVDAFAGSGTTGVAAHATGRRAILGDMGAVAIATARARLLREGAGLRVDACSLAPALPSLDVRASVKGDLVRLVAPEEPLAWAIGEQRDAVFHCLWHAERAPGARAVAAMRQASLAVPKGAIARAWADDGSVGDAKLSRPRQGGSA